MFDLITVLTRSRALRIACEAYRDDHLVGDDTSEHEEAARIALVGLAAGMDMQLDPERPARWSDCATLAAKVEAAAHRLAGLREGTFDQVGAVASLTLRFGAIASRLGYAVEPLARTHDDAAMAAVEHREAAE